MNSMKTVYKNELFEVTFQEGNYYIHNYNSDIYVQIYTSPGTKSKLFFWNRRLK